MGSNRNTLLHAIACAICMQQEEKAYVHSYFKSERYMRTYEGAISPCAGERHLPKKEMPCERL